MSTEEILEDITKTILQKGKKESLGRRSVTFPALLAKWQHYDMNVGDMVVEPFYVPTMTASEEESVFFSPTFPISIEELEDDELLIIRDAVHAL